MKENKGLIVAASAPKIPQLDTESVDTWIHRAEAKFRTSAITVSRTKVDYALDAIPRDVVRKCQLSSVYSNDDPWKTLKERLKVVLGQDPLAVISRMFTGDYDSSSCLARHADMSEALESVPDLRKTWLQFGILWLLPEADHEAFLATHPEHPIYEFAAEADLLRSRKSFRLGDSTASLNAVGSSGKSKKKPTVCFYHRKFGKKAVKCEKYPECPPLVAGVEELVNNVLFSGELSSDED